jgi:hypothetical protein
MGKVKVRCTERRYVGEHEDGTPLIVESGATAAVSLEKALDLVPGCGFEAADDESAKAIATRRAELAQQAEKGAVTSEQAPVKPLQRAQT